jgi:hypothetical protein
MRLESFNLNNDVYMRLTPTGKKILNTQPYKLSAWKTDDEGYIHIPLWEVMRIFGKEMRMGMSEVPFVNNEIMIDTDKFERASQREALYFKEDV